MPHHSIGAARAVLLVLGMTLAIAAFGAALPRPAVATTLRLYVFDCGTLHIKDTTRFGLKPTEVATPDLSVPCFLAVHPKGTLLWDTGAVPDGEWSPSGATQIVHITLPDAQQRDISVTLPLREALAALGYQPRDVTYLALSHYHYDHTANANDYAAATWIVRRAEREAMFAATAPGTTRPATYEKLRDSRTVLLADEDKDVFGDGTVVLKAAPGHTPGHQVLFLKLPKTGPVLLSGDLYHYPAERALDRVPTFEFDPLLTRASRTTIEAFLKRTGAQLWIQHDYAAFVQLRKAPNYYE